MFNKFKSNHIFNRLVWTLYHQIVIECVTSLWPLMSVGRSVGRMVKWSVGHNIRCRWSKKGPIEMTPKTPFLSIDVKSRPYRSTSRRILLYVLPGHKIWVLFIPLDFLTLQLWRDGKETEKHKSPTKVIVKCVASL